MGAERLHYTPPDPLCHSLIHLRDDAQEAGIWNPGAKYEKFLSGCHAQALQGGGIMIRAGDLKSAAPRDSHLPDVVFNRLRRAVEWAVLLFSAVWNGHGGYWLRCNRGFERTLRNFPSPPPYSRENSCYTWMPRDAAGRWQLQYDNFEQRQHLVITEAHGAQPMVRIHECWQFRQYSFVG